MRQRHRAGVLVFLAGLFGVAACLSNLDERDLDGAGADAGAAGAGDTGGPGCGVGQTVCADGCVDTQTSLGNCGACDNECMNGEVCAGGDCTPLCGESQLFCEGACRTVVSDTAHCGGCGQACDPGDFCFDGACTAECPFEVCATSSGDECADVSSNPSHCGTCGAACADGASCVQGACELVCPVELAECEGGCVDLSSNAEHCGACGTACSAGTPCVGGTCGCRMDLSECEGGCFDLSSDGENCGICGNACPPGQACSGGTCATGCGELDMCGSDCVDTGTNSAHCGACDAPCQAAESCVGGECGCPGGGSVCGGVCVDTDGDASHCGTCGKACAPGQHCAGGSCACDDSGLDACGSECVDTATSGQHCGACNAPCLTGQTCTDGRCACDGGLTACDGACVDTSMSSAHCGACGTGCAADQACMSGRCAATTGVDGCTATPARQVTVTQVSVYQAVRADIMRAGAEVPQASRNTDVVVGRAAIFRVHLAVAEGFTPRELSARLSVSSETNAAHFSRKTIRDGSIDASPDNTFQIAVPASSIRADTRYSIELVECGAVPSGSPVAPRFPATSDIALAARQVGSLKIRIIPLIANQITPATTEDALVPYRQLMEAMYPVTAVEFSVGATMSVSSATDWSGNLKALQDRRAADAPPADVYYYGFLQPTATRAQFCASGCSAGVGMLATNRTLAAARVAMGLAYPDSSSPLTMAHEIGHTHGREHAPCGTSSFDDQYPYANGTIGVRGFDRRTSTFIEPTSNDILGFCGNQWISDYTYDALLERVAFVNGN